MTVGLLARPSTSSTAVLICEAVKGPRKSPVREADAVPTNRSGRPRRHALLEKTPPTPTPQAGERSDHTDATVIRTGEGLSPPVGMP